MIYSVKHFSFENRIDEFKYFSSGVVKSEKVFPVFEKDILFKPLSKTKPVVTPLFAYAEVFWSRAIHDFFFDVPLYSLAICEGYEKVFPSCNEYGTCVPRVFGKMMNLLEFFQKYPDEKVQIDGYVNYCMMFYDYTMIFESDFFKNHRSLSKGLAFYLLVSILKADQNYHYENVSFLCDEKNQPVSLAPMLDHEYSSYFMFYDILEDHFKYLDEFEESLQNEKIDTNQYVDMDEKERYLKQQSSIALHKNILYIKKHFPDVAKAFLKCLDTFEKNIDFRIQIESEYPFYANSYLWLEARTRYKEKDLEKAQEYKECFKNKGIAISMERLQVQLEIEIQHTIDLMKQLLEEKKES